MSNQEKRQQSVRAVTGTAYHYEADWHALFDAAGIASGFFNERLLAWINLRLSTSYTNLNDAMRAFSISQDVANWNELGTFQAGLYRKPITITGSSGGAQTDYQIAISVAYESHMQSDFSDVVFKDSNRNSLSFWRESYTASTSAVFWVKVPSIPADPGTVTIYLYYGGSTSLDGGNGFDTFPLFDHFDPEVDAGVTTAIPSQNSLSLVSTEIITGAGSNEGFGCLLVDSSGVLAVHDTNKTWLYTLIESGGNWTCYVRQYNLDTRSVESAVQVKNVDSGMIWATTHLVIKLASDNYVMFYSSNTTGSTARTIRAAFCSTPNGTFVRDTGFEITSTVAWEVLLESDPRWIKLTEDATTLTGWLGYSSLNASSSWMGWAEISINKSTNAVTLVQKKSTNPLSGLKVGSHGRAYSGGNIDAGITVNGNYPVFFQINGTEKVGYAEASAATFDSGVAVRSVFCAPMEDVGEKYQFYIWNGVFHLYYEGHGGTPDYWKTYCHRYSLNTFTDRWVNESQLQGSVSHDDSILTFEGGNGGNNVTEARIKSIQTFAPGHAMMARVKATLPGSTLSSFWGFGDSYRYPAAQNAAILNAFNDSRFYWANFKTGLGSGFSSALFTPGQWYKTEIRWTSSQVDYVRDGSSLGTKNTQVPLVNCNVRLNGVQYHGETIFDWVAVRKYVSPEPSASVGAEEFG